MPMLPPIFRTKAFKPETCHFPRRLHSMAVRLELPAVNSRTSSDF